MLVEKAKLPELAQCRASVAAPSLGERQESGGVKGHTRTRVDSGRRWSKVVGTAPRA